MTEPTYLLTGAQRDNIIEALNTHPDFDADDVCNAAVGMLQSLPLITGEPASPLRDAVFKVCEGYTLHAGARKILETALFATPLYTHAQPLQPTTADMVTTDMLEAQLADVQKNYLALILCVTHKFKDETLHQTAKRYLCSWEGRSVDKSTVATIQPSILSDAP